MKKKFIEIGSSADGAWGIDLLKKGYTGYFVEPHPANLIALESLLQRKNISSHRYHLMNMAVWTEAGIRNLNVKETTLQETGEVFHLQGTAPFYEAGKSIRRPVYGNFAVSCVTLGDLLAWTGFPSYIWMDIEGAEVPILMGYEWSYLPEELHVEFHNRAYIQKVNLRLEAQGFKLINFPKKWNYLYGPQYKNTHNTEAPS